METGKRVDSYTVVMIDQNTGDTHHFAGWEVETPHNEAASAIEGVIRVAGHADFTISTSFFTA
jgi:hypothetical protein